MDEKLNHIIEETSKLFIRYGVKSISMDDIANHLGISKKTLYQHFADKKDLVLSIITHHTAETNYCFRELSQQEGNAIDILVKVSEILIENFGRINPAVNFDLQKYYPEAFKALMDHKRSHVLENIEHNLNRGIKEGLYRKGLNVKIIAYFYMARMDQIFALDASDESLKEVKTEDILRELFIYHIRGIANEKGIEYLENKLLKELKGKK